MHSLSNVNDFNFADYGRTGNPETIDVTVSPGSSET
jgi:hypothetical protein